MLDGTSRCSLETDTLFHYTSTSTFANYTVVPMIVLVKVREDAPFYKICNISCGVTTGIRAAICALEVIPGANVAVFRLDGTGINVIQSASIAGANKVIGVDREASKAATAEKFGMTDFVDTSKENDVVTSIIDLADGGADYGLWS